MRNQQSTQLDIYNVEELLSKMENALEKANYMQSELTDNFFGKYNHLNDKEIQTAIIWEYNRHGVFAEIVEDNITTAKEALVLLLSEVKKAIKYDRQQAILAYQKEQDAENGEHKEKKPLR